jgi:uncharacterized protein
VGYDTSILYYHLSTHSSAHATSHRFAAKLKLPFFFGLGGNIGSGRQWLPCVSLSDAAAAVKHCLTCDALRGPVNVVTPEPCTNAQFTAALASAMSRPAFLPMPELAARLVFGEMGEELLLSSQRCSAQKLVSSGFVFQHPNVAACIADAMRP